MAEEDVDLEWFKHKPFEEDYTVTRLLGEVRDSPKPDPRAQQGPALRG